MWRDLSFRTDHASYVSKNEISRGDKRQNNKTTGKDGLVGTPIYLEFGAKKQFLPSCIRRKFHFVERAIVASKHVTKRMFPHRFFRRRRRNSADDDDIQVQEIFMPDMIPAVLEEALRRGIVFGNNVELSSRSDFPVPLKCPSCQFPHPYAPYNTQGPQPPLVDEHCFSHHARVVFQSGTCPICLEDCAGPPLVNLLCGHTLCLGCFQQLGGRNGAQAAKSVQQAGREEYEQYRGRMRQEMQDLVHDDDDNIEEYPVRLPEEASIILTELFQSAMFQNDDEDENSGDNDGDLHHDEYDSDLDNDDEDDTDNDMPPLINRTALDGRSAEQSSPETSNASDNESFPPRDDASGDDTDDDMPQSIGFVTGNGGNTDQNNLGTSHARDINSSNHPTDEDFPEWADRVRRRMLRDRDGESSLGSASPPLNPTNANGDDNSELSRGSESDESLGQEDTDEDMPLLLDPSSSTSSSSTSEASAVSSRNQGNAVREELE